MGAVEILLHVCCAPCAVACVDQLRGEGLEPVGWYFNPNIHPLTEFLARRSALAQYAGQAGLRLLESGDYGLRDFLRAVGTDFDARCQACYRARLFAAARRAAEEGFSAFTTTLLISPYQNRELLLETGCEAARQCGVEFLARDFRPLFRDGQRRAREMGLYMQKYCGCIFSEEDRYRQKPPRTDSKR